jgi:DNA mismatch repair ATPase MutS
VKINPKNLLFHRMGDFYKFFLEEAARAKVLSTLRDRLRRSNRTSHVKRVDILLE